MALWHEPAEPADRLANWARLLAGYLQARIDAARSEPDRYTLKHGPLLPRSVLMLYTCAEAPLWAGLLALCALAMTMDDDDLRSLLELPRAVAEWAAVLQDWAVTGVVVAPAELDADTLTGPDLDSAELMLQLRGLVGELGDLPDIGHLFTPVLEAARQGPGGGPALAGRPWRDVAGGTRRRRPLGRRQATTERHAGPCSRPS